MKRGADEFGAETTAERLYEAVDRRIPYLFVAPAIVLAIGLLVYPLAWAVKLSLYEVSTFALDDQTFVGLANYQYLLDDPFFYQVMGNTLVFVGASVVGQLGLGLGLALLLDRDWLGRGAGWFRASFVLPWATTGVIVGYSWQFLFEPRVGLVNTTLRAIGMVDPPTWLGSLQWAMVALVIANVWQGVPFSLIFQTSGLQSLRRSWYEAAEVGGASGLQTLRYVVLPQLRPFLLMNLILITLFTFNVFDLIFVMTGGGPLDSTEVLALHMYDTAFEIGRFGRASALAVVLFMVNLVMVVAYLVVFGRRGGQPI